MSETLARGEIGKALADRGCKLEAVTGAGRADHQAAAALEDERLVRRCRVEACLRGHWIGRGSGSPCSLGSTSGPPWCAPTFSPWTGSASEYISCVWLSGLNETSEGIGLPFSGWK